MVNHLSIFIVACSCLEKTRHGSETEHANNPRKRACVGACPLQEVLEAIGGRVLSAGSSWEFRTKGLCLYKQPVLVARRTPSGTGPIVGATASVAVLRQVQPGRFAQGIQGA